MQTVKFCNIIPAKGVYNMEKEKVAIYRKWWFWVVFFAVIIILVTIAIFTIDKKIERELDEIRETSKNSYDNDILIYESTSKEILSLKEFEGIYNINEQLMESFEEDIELLELNKNPSGDKEEETITIRDVSNDGEISYIIEYDLKSEDLNNITIKNLSETSNSSYKLLCADVAQSNFFALNEEIFREVWNHISNESDMNLTTGNWNIINNSEFDVFTIQKAND